MKNVKGLLVVLLVFLMLATVIGCQGDSVTEAPKEEEVEKYKIGLSLPSFEFTLFAAMNELFLSEAQKMGVEGQVFNGEFSQAKQNQDIEDMVAAGFDAIIVCPITIEGAASAMQYVNDNNIPLFTVDRQVTPEMGIDVISHISVDQYAIGYAGGEAFMRGMEEKFPDAEEWIVLELEGTPGASSAIDRTNGINDAFAASTNFSKLNKLPNLVANYDTATAVSVTEDVLTAHPEVMGIIAANDMMIEGALQALMNFNRVGLILLVGMDGQISTVEKIIAGSVFATPTTTPLMATDSLEAAIKYLEGETVDELIVAPSQLIDISNAQEYLDSPLAW